LRTWILLSCLVAVLAGMASCLAGDKEGEAVREEIDAWVSSVPDELPAGDASLGTGSIVYRLSGEGGGVWHVRLAEAEVTAGPGEVEDPRATIACSAEDFAALVRGELDATEAYFTGRLQVSGDGDFAQGLHARLAGDARGEGERVTTDTSGWYAFEPLPLEGAGASAADASDLLDAPAGKHGFLRVKGDEFVFEDGTPVRFWGTNIVAGEVFMDHETARRTAARLARFGCNLVRLHHMDADWAEPNIFDPSYDDTQHLSAESLDRLDYLISELKKQGIYVFLDLLVHRKFKAGDGVRDWEGVGNGAKVVAHFNRRIIELQKTYAHDLYTHVNAYTGLRYCDDPAIAMSEIINESSLFWDWGYADLPDSYIAEVNGLYREWAKREEVEVAEGASVREGLDERDADVLRFLYETQVAYFTEMRDYLRSIGVRVPLAGSNHWEAMALDLKSNLVMDFVDRHGYWDHPQGGYSPDDRFDNRPMVKGRGYNLVTWLSRQQLAGKPLTVSEWNCCWINDYIAEGPLLMAAYGAFQGWDGVLQFDYEGGDWSDTMWGSFNAGSKPHVLGTWPAAARLFIERQVRPGAPLVVALDPGEVAGGAELAEAFPELAGLQRRLLAAFGEGGASGAAGELAGAEEGALASDTGELSWDIGRGLVTVDSPGFAGRIGFAQEPVELGAVSIDVEPEFAVVGVTALDGLPIARSAHLLITAAARAENTNMVYAAGRKSAYEAGEAPILMQPVRGEIGLRMAGSDESVEVYALDSIGGRTGVVEVEREESRVVVPLEADSFWYEVVMAR
jgi:hypothetical protein